MFDSLSDRLSDIFGKLTRHGALREKDVDTALREVRHALLEADVSLEAVRSFIDKVRVQAIGHGILNTVTPGQQVVKIVNDELVALLGGQTAEIDLVTSPPTTVMLVGLQGSGKTTTAAKLARRLAKMKKCRPLLASLDVHRPAAQEQLNILGSQAGIDTLPIISGQSPTEIAARAMQTAKRTGIDIVILDTAGRTHVDEPLMEEMSAIKAISKPHEILLVADSLTGQDAVSVARSFDERVGLTGIVLTRLDGDGRGGAALSMSTVVSAPIKYAGMGEKLDDLELFQPERIASQILGMGDIVGLVEKAAQNIDTEKAEKLNEKIRKGRFDLEDLAGQLEQMTRMGGIGGLLGMLPGMGRIKQQISAAHLDDRIIKRQLAIISSMTPVERRHPELLKASRKRRIAAGSGSRVEDINRLLKMQRQMADMAKAMGKNGFGEKKAGGLASLLGGGPAGMPDMSSIQNLMSQGFPKTGLPKTGLPGIGQFLPKGFDKKK